MSIQPSKLAIAFCAIVVICLTGWVMDSISHTVVIGHNGLTELDLYTRGILDEDTRAALFRNSGQHTGVFTALWGFTGQHLHSALLALSRLDFYDVLTDIIACFLALVWSFRFHAAYSLIFFAVTLAVLSVTGGAICRIVALQFSQADKPSLTEALRFSIRKFASLFAAPLTPIAIILVVGAFIILLGLWGNIPIVGELSVGLFLPLALIVAAAIAVIAIGVAGGLALMFPTIAYEDSDCFDAISHSFSYAYARPWRLGFYVAVASIYGAICYAFVRFFLFFILWIAYTFLQLGFMHKNAKLHVIWPAPRFAEFLATNPTPTAVWSTSAGAFLVHLWVLVVIGLMISFVISFYFSAGTIIYALMRHRVDRVPLNEVYTYSDKTRAEAAPASLTTEGTPAKTKPPCTNAPDEKAGTPE